MRNKKLILLTRPRTCGLPFSSRTSLSLFKPSAFTLRRCFHWQLFMLLKRRTRIVPAAALVCLALAITAHLIHFLATLGGDALRRRHGLQTLDGGAHQIDRVARTDGLGQHVLDAHHFEDCAHRATG